jgi:hypothetical protein
MHPIHRREYTLATVSQFLPLGRPTDTIVDMVTWAFELPNEVHADKVSVLLFRIQTTEAPRIRAVLNEKEILRRDFPRGTIVSYHLDVPRNVLQPGSNILRFRRLAKEGETNEKPPNVAAVTLFYRENV